jgi:hypothetical protein
MTEPSRRRIIHFVDNWKFWSTVFGFALIGVIVFLFVLYGRTAREEADRVARTRSAAVQQVAACFLAVKNAPVVQGFLDSHKALIENGIDANEAFLRLDESPALTQIRKDSLVRLRAAQANVAILDHLVAATTPTEKSCIKNAKATGVPYNRYLKQLHPSKKPKKTPTPTTTASS